MSESLSSTRSRVVAEKGTCKSTVFTFINHLYITRLGEIIFKTKKNENLICKNLRRILERRSLHHPLATYTTYLTLAVIIQTIRGGSKIKLKNVNKKRMATARRLIFLEFLKAFIAYLITLFFSSLQNSEGGGDSNSGDSFADPCQFLPFPKTKI
jgi:hypothetical protein